MVENVPEPAPRATKAVEDAALRRRAEAAEQKLSSLSETMSALEAQVAGYREALDHTLGTLRQQSARQQEVIEALTAEIRQHRLHSAESDAAVQRLECELEQARRDSATREAEFASLTALVAELRAEGNEFKRLGADFAFIQRDLEFTREGMRAAQHEVGVMRLSSSWRFTAPLRALIRRFGGTTTEKLLRTGK